MTLLAVTMDGEPNTSAKKKYEGTPAPVGVDVALCRSPNYVSIIMAWISFVISSKIRDSYPMQDKIAGFLVPPPVDSITTSAQTLAS